jgi:hypothetical protein
MVSWGAGVPECGHPKNTRHLRADCPPVVLVWTQSPDSQETERGLAQLRRSPPPLGSLRQLLPRVALPWCSVLPCKAGRWGRGDLALSRPFKLGTDGLGDVGGFILL